MKKIFFVTVLIIISAAIGFASGVSRSFPYSIAKSIQGWLVVRIDNKIKLEQCEIETLAKLPNKFSVVIGHAYGAPAGSAINDFIAPSVENFLLSNKESIDSLVFTGDIFSVPSSEKWQKLYGRFENLDIHIAPGNHDILRPDSREVFQNQKFIRKDFPYSISRSGHNILLSDSITSNWAVSESLSKMIESQSSDLIIARHNVVTSEFLNLANSRAGSSELPNVQELLHSLQTEQKITWIIGDGGAFSHLPRLTCNKINNHRFIVNGIGEVQGDKVIILNRGKLFQYSLK